MIHERIPPHDARPCICRICTCGKHECPGITLMRPFNGITSYTEDYPPKEVPMSHRSPRSKALPMPSKAEPGHFTTTNQAAFDPVKEAQGERASPFRPRDNPVAPTKFNGTTTQRTDYVEYPIETPVRHAPRQAIPPRKGAGTWETTNKAMQDPVAKAYRDGEVRLPQLAKTNEGLPRDDLPFDGITSYKEHYPPKASEPHAKPTPRAAAIPRAPDNRDFLTTNGVTFAPHARHRRLPCPAAVAPRRPPSTDGHIKVTEPIDLEKYAEYY